MTLLTWDEFLALPHETRNAALIDGDVMEDSPDAAHEKVSTQQPVKAAEDRGYQPDFAWYPPERCAPPEEDPFFTGLPDLIVEVFSPSTRYYDLKRKRADYERLGIGELWYVDPLDRSVLLFQRPGDGEPFREREVGVEDTITSRLLDGFSLVVGELVRR